MLLAERPEENMTIHPLRGAPGAPSGGAPRRAVFPRAAFLAVPVLLWALAGCARHDLPRTWYDAGTPKPFKRVPLHDTVDFLHNCRAKVYKKCKKAPHKRLSSDQQAVLDEFGKPDYLRKAFRSEERERVKEWVYLENDRVVQFIDGDNVYAGPVTDRDQVLIFRGLPRYAIVEQEEVGPRLEKFFYRNWLGTELDVYTFADGKLVTMNK